MAVCRDPLYGPTKKHYAPLRLRRGFPCCRTVSWALVALVGSVPQGCQHTPTPLRLPTLDWGLATPLSSSRAKSWDLHSFGYQPVPALSGTLPFGVSYGSRFSLLLKISRCVPTAPADGLCGRPLQNQYQNQYQYQNQNLNSVGAYSQPLRTASADVPTRTRSPWIDLFDCVEGDP